MLATLRAAADDDDVGSGSRERLRHAAAEDAGAAEDNGDFAFQVEEVRHLGLQVVSPIDRLAIPTPQARDML